MSDESTEVHHVNAFVLAKDEAPNIQKCLRCLVNVGIAPVVLDSGSTDTTIELANAISGVSVEQYNYVDHASAYNWIIEKRTPAGMRVLILDADMEVTPQLWTELLHVANQRGVEVVKTPIQMCVEGIHLKTGSLCPPKTVLFVGGRAMFEGCGHGERLRDGILYATTTEPLIHDDRKPYAAYLASQLRYANNLCQRSHEGSLTFRDRLRLQSPILALLVPVYSYLFKGGIFSGRVGALYAIDRVIAELLQFRQALAKRVRAHSDRSMADQNVPASRSAAIEPSCKSGILKQ